MEKPEQLLQEPIVRRVPEEGPLTTHPEEIIALELIQMVRKRRIGNAEPIGSYWPYATSLWDYIHRAMPYTRPGSLSTNEIYALTAFLPYENGIIGKAQVMNRNTLAKVRMPNRSGFVPYTGSEVHCSKSSKTLKRSAPETGSSPRWSPTARCSSARREFGER